MARGEESYNSGATSARALPRSPEKKPKVKRHWGGFEAHMSGIPKSFSVEERAEAKGATHRPCADLHTR